jgi:hypothetical protein
MARPHRFAAVRKRRHCAPPAYDPVHDSGETWASFVHPRGRQLAITAVATSEQCLDECSSDLQSARRSTSHKTLVATFIEKHFFDLPSKSFIFLYTSENPEDTVHIHTIMLDDGSERAARSFGTGTYNNEIQTIPPDFAAVEAAIQHVRDNAFPTTQACGVAAPARF